MTIAISASSTANDEGRDIGAMIAPVPWRPDKAPIRKAPSSPRKSPVVIGISTTGTERLPTVDSVSSKSGLTV
jgi:hypothetical protein